MLRRFYPYFHQYRKYALFACLCVIAEVIFELLIPLLMADLIDTGIANGDKAYIITKGLQMCLLALLALLFGSLYARLAAICGQGLGSEIRKAEFAKIQSFSFSNTDRFTASSLVTRMTSDVTVIQNAVSTGLRPMVRAPIMLLMGIFLSAAINLKLAVVFLAAVPVLGSLLFLIIRRVRPLYTRMQRAVDMVNRIVQENLTAIRTVKAYARGDYETAKFSEVNSSLQTVSEKAFRTASLNMPAMQFCMYATILCILWFGGKLIFTGDMQVGELTGFLSYVLQILNSLMMISNIFMMLTRSLASGRRIAEVLNEEPDIRDETNPQETYDQETFPDSVRRALREITRGEITRGDIVFDHVSFRYNEKAEEPALSDVSLRIRAGSTVGIIGGTGSAKTTLVQLIPRLYEATSGQVLVGGLPVRKYPLAHLREAIAVVLQKNTLFSGTISDNLRWGKEDASPEELRRACEIACAHEFIEGFPDGYGTWLEQGGVNLSGGQKQRLCIARAILKSPKVLILDDSTSAVDSATESRIRDGLAQCLPGTTKIIIAQRITSVMDADQIIIMDNGRIHASGTHETLLASSPIYQEIYRSQQEGVLA